MIYFSSIPLISLLISCSTTSESIRTPALFETRAEAEKVAKDFNCSGAHQMGDKWMPCQSNHGQEEGDKHEKHDGHNHH